MTKKNEGLAIETDEPTKEEKLRASQNRIIAIILLYIGAIAVYFVGRSDVGISNFEVILIIFLIANTIYLGIEAFKLIKIWNE